MLDHVFTDAIGALRDTLESAMLERQMVEERLAADILLGDLTWETAYGLPGEGQPPRVQAELHLVWSTWSQSAFRSWYIGEPLEDIPRIDMEVVVRLQRLAEEPDVATVLAALPEESPAIGAGTLRRSAPTVETLYAEEGTEWAFEVSYEGVYELFEDVLADGSAIDKHLEALGGWITATLVRLGDLPFRYHPPVDADPGP